jgi:membrane protein DedA with SNARE-associated domain
MARTTIGKLIIAFFLLLDGLFMLSVFLALIRNLITFIVGIGYPASKTFAFAFIGLVIDVALLYLGYWIGGRLWQEIEE